YRHPDVLFRSEHPLPQRSALCPYTTLFRSQELARAIEEVPIPARLGRVLELGEVEVDGLAAVGLRPSRVEEREGGAEDRGVHRRSEGHTSELQSLRHLVCRLLLGPKHVLVA